LVKLEAAPADHVEVAISDTRVWVLGSSWEAGGVRIDAFDTNGRRVAPPTHLGMGTGPLQQQLDTATSGTARRALLAIAHASGELTFVQRSAQGEGFARALVHLDSMGRPTATTPLSPLLGPWALEALICLVGENASGQVFLAASPPTSYTHPRIYTVDPRTGATTGQADAPLVSPVGDGFVSDTRITVVGDGVAAVARVLQPSPVPAFALPPPPAIPPFALPLPTSVSPGGPF
jgi:hypothetical protein